MLKFNFISILLFASACFGQTQIRYISGGSYLVEGTQVSIASTNSLNLSSYPATNHQITGSVEQNVYLPNAQSYPEGRNYFVDNSTTQNLVVRYNDGSVAKTLVSGSQSNFILTDNSSSNGSWSITSAGLPSFVSGSILTNDGSQPYWQSGSSWFANPQLSNLGSTAVNTNIIPDSTSTRSLGDSAGTLRWQNIWGNFVSIAPTGSFGLRDPVSTSPIMTLSPVTAPDGTASALLWRGTVTSITSYPAIGLATRNQSPQKILIQTGNGNGVTNSASIDISTGLAPGFTRGEINLAGSIVTVGNMKIASMADPTNVSDAATKNYVDQAIATVSSPSFASQSANYFYGGPPSGASSPPTFRPITQNDLPKISLVSGVSGTLSVVSGGTGLNAILTGDILIASAPNTISNVPAGTSGYVLTSNGPGTMASWQAPTASSGSATVLAPGVVLVNAASTIDPAYSVILASGGNYTLTFVSTASYASNQLLKIIKTSTEPTTISTAGSITKTLYTPNESYTFSNFDTNFLAVAHNSNYKFNPETISVTAVTTNPNKGTNSTDRASCSRRGSFLVCDYAYVSTGNGTNGSGTYNLSLPTYVSGIATIDSTRTIFYTGSTVANAYFSKLLAQCSLNNNSSFDDRLYIYPFDQTRMRLVGVGFNSFWGSGTVGFGGTMNMHCAVEIPMTNWEEDF
jgi:hypothetical protein